MIHVTDDRTWLIAQLSRAYSGELAAALAYRGHWRSTRDPEARRSVRRIEEEEWHHRRLVGQWLTSFGAKTSAWREARAFVVGCALGLFCYIAGTFLPMYAAGRLESHNVREYEALADCAGRCGYPHLVECLLSMAEVEWDHEAYFRSQVAHSRWLALFPLWPAIPGRRRIRETRIVGSAASGALS